MGATDILGIDKWIADSGVKIVTGVHVSQSESTGFGLSYDNDENSKDEMQSREAEEMDSPQSKDAESLKKTVEISGKGIQGEQDESGNISVSNITTNNDDDNTNSDDDDSAFEEFEEFNEEYDYEDDDEKIVVLVPSKLVSNADTIREISQKDGTLRKWLEAEPRSDKNVLHLGLVYLWKFAPKTHPWTGYFDLSPKNIDLPYTFKSKKMEDLDSSNVSLSHTAIKMRLEIEKSYERFLKIGVTENDSSLQDWLLPHAWISSRGITHPHTQQTCSVPVIDSCNHSSTKSNARYEADEEGNFESRLTERGEDIGKSEIFLNYGDRSTGEFFFNYGFIPEDRDDDGFDEVFKVFNPSLEDIKNVLDLSRSKDSGLSEEARHELGIRYDVLVEFFEPVGPQVLRIIRFPKIVEPDEKKRYRFHNHLIMALACSEKLELHGSKDKKGGLFLKDVQLTPTNVFDVVRQLNDEKVLTKARALVVKLCDYFYSQVSNAKIDDPDIKKLAKAESSLFKHYADANR